MDKIHNYVRDISLTMMLLSFITNIKMKGARENKERPLEACFVYLYEGNIKYVMH
jgi:hypothetical protein